MSRLSLSPRVWQLLTAYLCALVGCVIGFAIFVVQTGVTYGCFSCNTVADVAGIALFPIVVALVAPMFVAFGFVFEALHMTAGDGLAVALALSITMILLALLVCALFNAYTKRWPWLRWFWRAYLIAQTGAGMYVMMYASGI